MRKLTEQEVEIISDLMYRAHQTIGYDLQTPSGMVGRQALYEVIMDSGWLDELTRSEEEKLALRKFKDLEYTEREEYISEVLSAENYECGTQT